MFMHETIFDKFGVGLENTVSLKQVITPHMREDWDYVSECRLFSLMPRKGN